MTFGSRPSVLDHWIAFVPGEGASAVVTVGHALSRSGVGQEGDEDILISGLPASGVFQIDSGSARKAVLDGHRFREQGVWQLLPVHQVLADSVSQVMLPHFHPTGLC